MRSEDAAVQLFPPGNPQNPFPPAMSLGPDTTSGNLRPDLSQAAARDRPVLVLASQPSWIVAGTSEPAPHGVADWGGPLLGAEGGRKWRGAGSIDVLTFEPGTVLKGTRFHDGAPASTFTGQNDAGQWATWEAPADAPAQPFHLETSRPVAVFPQGGPTAFFAGRPPSLVPVLGAASFRGHLVEIRSPTGVDPVAISVLPGQSTEIAFTLTNHGRDAAGRGIPDTFMLDVPAVEGWTVSIDQGLISLPGHGSATVKATVTAPADALPGEAASFAVTATSQGNPAIGDRANVFARVRTSYALGIWFDVENGAKAREIPTAPGKVEAVDVVLRNTGSVADQIELDLAGGGVEWKAQLLRGSDPVASLKMDAGQSVRLTLRVEAIGEQSTVSIFTVRARSVASPAVTDQVTLTTFVQRPSDVSLELDRTSIVVTPGSTAWINGTLRNDGEGSALLGFDVRFDDPAWPPAVMFIGQGADRVAADRLAVAPGDEVPVSLSLEAPAADAGARSVLRVAATSPRERSSVEAYVLAEVGLAHDLTLLPTVEVADGGVRLRLEVRNAGNGHETLRVAGFHGAPGPVSGPGLIEVDQGATVQAVWTIAAGAPGPQEVHLMLEAADGNVSEAVFAFEMAAAARLVAGFARHLEVQPAERVPVTIHVANTGNQGAWARLGMDIHPHARLEAATHRVPPGASIDLPGVLVVGRDAPDGPVTLRLDVLWEDAEAGSTDAPERLMGRGPNGTVVLDVGRPELALGIVAISPAPTGRAVMIDVRNDGNRAALDVLVQARDAEARDEATLGRIEPGQTRSLVLAVGAAGRIVVEVDPDRRLVEQSLEDNVLESAGKEAAAPFWPVGIVAAAILARRRPAR